MDLAAANTGVFGNSSFRESQRENVVKLLRMVGTRQFLQSFARKNLYFKVEQKDAVVRSVGESVVSGINNKKVPEAYKRLLQYLSIHKGKCGIVYCMTVKLCRDLSQWLEQKEMSVSAYHGQRRPRRREEIFTKWMGGGIDVVGWV